MLMSKGRISKESQVSYEAEYGLWMMRYANAISMDDAGVKKDLGVMMGKIDRARGGIDVLDVFGDVDVGSLVWRVQARACAEG
jgi:hypothetical protein